MERTTITCDRCKEEIIQEAWTKVEIYYTDSETNHYVCDLCNACRRLVLAELGIFNET